MLKRILSGLVALVLAGTVGYGASIIITGTNSENRLSIFHVAMLRITRDEAVTATPSPTQANAYQITAGITQVTTVATAGDSLKLPVTTSAPGTPSGGGLMVIVINGAAANSLNVFPQTGDTINALAANATYAIPANKTVIFFCGADGKWYTNLTA